MPFEFDIATTPTARGNGLYDTPIQERWNIGPGIANGGYLLSIAANAMREECGRAHPLTLTAHYLSPGVEGPAETQTEIVKAGKRLTTMSGSLRSNGKEVIRVLGTFADEIDASTGAQFNDLTPPNFPPYNELSKRVANPDMPPSLQSRLDSRFLPEDAVFATGGKTGKPLMRGYFAFADGREVDTLGLLLASDAYPPIMFNLYGLIGWAPTIELTVHIRAVPAPGPIACKFYGNVVQGGYFEESGEMWDSTGRLVAMSRQLALAPLPQA
jgi:hypothetical protein